MEINTKTLFTYCVRDHRELYKHTSDLTTAYVYKSIVKIRFFLFQLNSGAILIMTEVYSTLYTPHTYEIYSDALVNEASEVAWAE